MALKRALKLTLGALFLWGIAGCTALSPEAATSFDGLERRPGKNADELWVRPYFDVRTYSRILFAPPKLYFRPALPGGSKETASAPTAFAVTPEQRESLQKILSTAFQQELARSKHFPMATKPAADVLTVHGDLLDVVSFIPPGATPSSTADLPKVGEATLVLELRDSQSDTIVVRAIKRVTAERGAPNTNTTADDVERTAHQWAATLREQLDTIASVDLNP